MLTRRVEATQVARLNGSSVLLSDNTAEVSPPMKKPAMAPGTTLGSKNGRLAAPLVAAQTTALEDQDRAVPTRVREGLMVCGRRARS